MGFRIGSECRIEFEDVAQEMCASMAGVSSAGVVRCVGVAPSAAGFVLNIETTSAGVTSPSQLQVPQIPCDEFEKFGDLSQLWGLGVVAVLGVFLVREFVYRLVAPQ